MSARRFVPRFSIRWLFVFVTASAVLVSYLVSRYEQEQLVSHVQAARYIADLILLEDHSVRDHGSSGTLRTLVNRLHLKSRPAYLLLSQKFKNGDPADDYEIDLLLDLQAGNLPTDVIVRRGVGDTVTYYNVIRDRGSCRGCHETGNAQPSQPLAVMKISMNASPR